MYCETSRRYRPLGNNGSIHYLQIHFLLEAWKRQGDVLYCLATLSIASHVINNIFPFMLVRFSDCDTTSTFLRQKKKKKLKIPDISILQEIVNIFLDGNAGSS